jgi:hypothetical protein
MRFNARASLVAGVAAVALLAGPGSHQGTSAPGFWDAVPLQIGSTAEAQARVSVGVFFDRLAPHGRWVRHSSHGYVFVPVGVGSDWRPYTQGRWAYTNDHGWYWVSDEPFGWATYHYGRWGYSRTYGWYWVPGNVWAPAWVTWRTGGDYVGWAPLAPEGRGYAWGAPTSFRPPVAESWVFVELRYISAPTIVEYVEPIRQIPVILTQATTRVDIRIEQNIVINQPIEITQIENVVVEPIQTVNVTFVDDPEQATDSEGDIVAFQAEISEEEPQEAPAEAVESADQIENPAIIEETLEDVPAEADAPSASEVADDVGETTPEDGAAAEELPETPDAEAPAVEEQEAEEPAADGAAEADSTDAAEEPQPPADDGAPGEPDVDEPESPAEQPADTEAPVGEEAPSDAVQGADQVTPDEGTAPASEDATDADPAGAGELEPTEEEEPQEAPSDGADVHPCPEGQEPC